jgi:hypothetical protein
MLKLYLHAPICLHGVVLNKLSTRTTLLLLDSAYAFLGKGAQVDETHPAQASGGLLYQMEKL